MQPPSSSCASSALGPCHGAAGPPQGPQLSVWDSLAPGCVHTSPALDLEALNLPTMLMVQPLREGEGLLQPQLRALCPVPAALHHCLSGQRSTWWRRLAKRPGPHFCWQWVRGGVTEARTSGAGHMPLAVLCAEPHLSPLATVSGFFLIGEQGRGAPAHSQSSPVWDRIYLPNSLT